MGRRIKRSKKVVRTVSRKNSNRRMTQRRVNKRRMTQRRVNKRRVNKRNMTKRNVARRIKRTNRKILKTLKRLRGGELTPNQVKEVAKGMFDRRKASKSLFPNKKFDKLTKNAELAAEKKARFEARFDAELDAELEAYKAKMAAEKKARLDAEEARMAAEKKARLDAEEARMAADKKARMAAEKEGADDIVFSNPLVDDPDDETSMEGGATTEPIRTDVSDVSKIMTIIDSMKLEDFPEDDVKLARDKVNNDVKKTLIDYYLKKYGGNIDRLIEHLNISLQ